MLQFTDEQFEELKKNVELSYQKFGDVWCPFLQSQVTFNAKGFDHLSLKRWNHSRNRDDQWTRLKLLHLAPEVIRKSHTLQGLAEGNKFERVKVHNKWETRMVHVSYYEFIALIQGCRIRIIVKKVADGPTYFWSIVPYWKQGMYGKKMFEGDPEID